MDHIGGLAQLVSEYGVPVLCHADEAANLVGPDREQVTLGRIVPSLWRGRVRRWLRLALRAQAEASLRRLAELRADALLPGHGPVLGGAWPQ